MPPRELIVVTDGPPRAELPNDIAGAAVRAIDWNDTRQLRSVGNSALLIDLDLRDISKVKTVKDNLPSRRRNQCRIVTIERTSRLSEAQAHGLGATDLLKRPFNVHDLAQILHRHFAVASAPEHSEPEPAVESVPGGGSITSAATALEGLFTSLTCGGALPLNELAKTGDQVIDAIAEIGVGRWLDTVRNYHEGTFQHCLLVTGVATAFGQTHGMRRSDVSILTLAGLLHDIGKAQIPLAILDKPDRLSDEEFSVIQSHPVIGYDYLLSQEALPQATLDAVRHHHEYLDGSGYPDGLRGDEIKDLTRILTICDVYGALVERRAYKAPKSPEVAIDILTKMANEGKVEADLVKALAHSVSLRAHP
jgi:putative nucleotidyltransferase with HDIG domain